MKTTVECLQTRLLDYETGRNDRKICIRTDDGNLKYNYLLKWLGELDDNGEQVITEIPDELLNDIYEAYDDLIYDEHEISELAMKTIMWDEMEDSDYDEEFFCELEDKWLWYLPEKLDDRITLVMSYLQAYKVLKRRMNKLRQLEIVRIYYNQHAMIDKLKDLFLTGYDQKTLINRLRDVYLSDEYLYT